MAASPDPVGRGSAEGCDRAALEEWGLLLIPPPPGKTVLSQHTHHCPFGTSFWLMVRFWPLGTPHFLVWDVCGSAMPCGATCPCLLFPSPGGGALF